MDEKQHASSLKKKSSTAFLFTSSKGQSTIELLIILTVLFTILAFSVRISSDQGNALNQRKLFLEAEENAFRVKDIVYAAGRSPVGTTLRVFLPPTTQTQTIRIENGLLEVRSADALVQIPLVFSELNAGPVNDGNFLTVEKTAHGVVVT
ncbi:MAG: hypothetical protein AABY11_03465 [archaeon]